MESEPNRIVGKAAEVAVGTAITLRTSNATQNRRQQAPSDAWSALSAASFARRSPSLIGPTWSSTKTKSLTSINWRAAPIQG